MRFAMPESYRAYCTDAAVRTAVNHILSSQNPKKPLGLPADIEWKDVPAFHKAVLSAHQVRCEFAVYLIDLWDAVWQPALDTCDFATELEPQNIAASQEWHDQKLDTNTVWDTGWFSRVFDIRRTRLQLAPGVAVDTERAWLSLCFWSQDDTDHTTGRNFGDDWPEQEIANNFAWTSKDLAPIRDDGTINLDILHKAAAGALAAVRTNIQN